MQGISKIENIKNGKVYIGSSTNITKRWNNHIDMLVYKTHHSHLLQEDFNKHKLHNFSFTVIERVKNKKNLLSIEQDYIDKYNNTHTLYNVLLETSYKSISISKEFTDSLNYRDSIPQDTINKLDIEFIEKRYKTNRYGNDKYDFSKAWFTKNYDQLKQVKLNIGNVRRNIMNVKSNQFAWTTYTSFYHMLTNKGYKKGFVPLNAEIEDIKNKRNYLCFVANLFPNSFVKNQYKNNIEIDDDKYALSIMLKWIVRVSNVDEKIIIYIPSDRMESLLKNFLIENNKEIKTYEK